VACPEAGDTAPELTQTTQPTQPTQPTTSTSPDASVEPVDPPTDIRAVAGRTLALEGAGAGGADITPSSGTTPSTPTVVTPPSPRWVLRDAHGTAVRALVSPGYAPTALRFADTTPATVFVNYAGQRVIQLNYSLDTGAVLADNGCTAADWHGLPSSSPCTVLFSNASCTDVGLVATSGVYVIGGKPHYATTRTTSIAAAYVWQNGACVTSPSRSGVPIAAVPDDVAGLLSAAPYTLELVY